jgi:hypothetical protein
MKKGIIQISCSSVLQGCPKISFSIYLFFYGTPCISIFFEKIQASEIFYFSFKPSVP